MPALLFALLKALKLIIIGDALLSWFMPNKEQFPRSFTSQVTDPLYAPIRAVIGPDKTGGLDLSPIAMLLLLDLMERMLARAL
ncbi:MAG TPA: YggT family protein [Polyangiales bacterium]